MAVIQSNLSELRYINRENLEQEARIIGNYYREIIRSYGVDCSYYKLKTDYFENYKDILDQNTLLRRAYGYDETPDYSISARMITYMEVESDALQLNRFGQMPNTDANFYFDANDFAIALASQLGQYKEYKIDETEVVMEVPAVKDGYWETTEGQKHWLSDEVLPYNLGLGYRERFTCDVMSGMLSCEIKSYELGKEQTVACDPYEHTEFFVNTPVNEYVLKSFDYHQKSDGYLYSLLFLTFTVNELDGKWILKGRLHGSVLFYDTNQIGKYMEKIHPDVGDIVTIDFPGADKREQYEITEAYDRNMTPDGVNPLLHKYIWRCHGRRYVNSQENMERNESNERLDERLDFNSVLDEQVTRKISKYDDNEDAVYGGYENDHTDFDKRQVDGAKDKDYDYIPDGSAIVIHEFACGSQMVTDGYELYFKPKKGGATRITTVEDNIVFKDNLVNTGLQYIKSSESGIYFVNFDGKTCKIVEDTVATKGQLELCINSLYDATFDNSNIN